MEVTPAFVERVAKEIVGSAQSVLGMVMASICRQLDARELLADIQARAKAVSLLTGRPAAEQQMLGYVMEAVRAEIAVQEMEKKSRH